MAGKITYKCQWCGHRTRASGGRCQSCKSKLFHASKRVEKEGLIVDQAGGGWWVWDAKGEVLVIGKDTKSEAYKALALGDTTDLEE